MNLDRKVDELTSLLRSHQTYSRSLDSGDVYMHQTRTGDVVIVVPKQMTREMPRDGVYDLVVSCSADGRTWSLTVSTGEPSCGCPGDNSGITPPGNSQPSFPPDRGFREYVARAADDLRPGGPRRH